MRHIRYGVAMSLDGYIAGPKGESDWIIMDPGIDFAAIFGRFDTLLMGRRTFEASLSMGGGAMPGVRTYVVSRTLKAHDHPGVTVIANDVEKAVAALREQPGKDIWLFGGGLLFAGLLNAGLVDNLDIAIVPVVLGAGIPLLTPPADRATLKLLSYKIYDTGIVALEYAIER